MFSMAPDLTQQAVVHIPVSIRSKFSTVLQYRAQLRPYPGFGISTTPNICPHDQDLTRNFGHRTTFGTVDDPTLLVPVLVQYWYRYRY